MYPAGMKTLLFDGDCGLCTRFLAFTDKRLSGRPFQYVSLASDEARVSLGEDYKRVVDLDTMAVVDSGAVYTQSDAALRVVAEMRPPWRWLRLLRVVPPWIRDRVYRSVARRRQWFGPADSCPVHLSAEAPDEPAR